MDICKDLIKLTVTGKTGLTERPNRELVQQAGIRQTGLQATKLHIDMMTTDREGKELTRTLTRRANHKNKTQLG